MTELDVRPAEAAQMLDAVPAPAIDGPRPMPARSLRTAVVIAAGVALAGLVIIAALVLITWGAEKRSTASAGTAVRAAGQAWLYAHHSPLGTSSGTVALVPLGLTALPLGLLIWAGVQVGRDLEPCGPADATRAALGMSATYGMVAFLVQAVCGLPGTRIGPLVAVLPAVGLSFLGAGAGIAHGSGLFRQLRTRMPTWLLVSLRAAVVASCIPLAAGAALVAVALAADGGRVVSLTGSLGVGVAGGAMLVVLCVLLAPNAIVCAAAMAVGPGFAVGTGTAVTVHAAALGPVPAFPLLAALPEGPAPSPMTWVIVAAPVFGGIVAGAALERVVRPRSWRMVLLSGAVTGAAAGALLALLAAAAGGPVGNGRLAAVGPSPWKVGAAFAIEVAVLASAMTGGCGWRRIREDRIRRGLARLRPLPIASLEVTPPPVGPVEADRAGTDAGAGATDSETDAQPEGEIHGEPEPETDAEPEAETDGEPEAECEAGSESDSAPESDPAETAPEPDERSGDTGG